MDHWNEELETDRFAAIRQQVESIREVMSSNMQRVLERGEQLENIEGRTEALTQSSQTFQWTARRVQRRICVKNAKWTIIIVVCLMVVAAATILVILRNSGVFDHS
ncbi:synaptobrevin family protein [Loa loa]|uniref:Synaptobrevin family protein n=1 Tax=Loa loa TaxID=7209 RepID=A0A1I7VVR4_LOALO|nr:synaptobrevin family protein [Loa loa]EFO14766.1 synaptobrevin family protein [Loa loa]